MIKSEGAAVVAFFRSAKGQVALSIADQMIVSAGSFAVVVMVGRILGPEPLGIFSLGVSISVFLLGTQTALLSTPWTIYRAKEPRERGRNARAGSFLIMAFMLSASTSAVLLMASQVILQLSPASQLGPVILVLALTLPVYLMREFGRRFDFARMAMTSALVWDAVATTMQVVGLLWFALNYSITPSRVFLVIACACGVSAFGWFAVNMKRNFTFVWGRLGVDMKRSFLLGRWALLEHVLWTATFFSMHWILYGTMTARETGILAGCASLAGVLSPVFQGIGNFLSPHIARSVASGNKRKTVRLISACAWSLAGIVSLFAIVVFAFGDNLLWTLYGKHEFDGYGYLAGLLALRLGFLTVRVPYLHTLMAMHLPRLAALATAIGLLVTVCVAVPMGSYLGITGVVVGGLSGVCVDLILIHRFTQFELLKWNWVQEMPS